MYYVPMIRIGQKPSWVKRCLISYVLILQRENSLHPWNFCVHPYRSSGSTGYGCSWECFVVSVTSASRALSRDWRYHFGREKKTSSFPEHLCDFFGAELRGEPFSAHIMHETTWITESKWVHGARRHHAGCIWANERKNKSVEGYCHRLNAQDGGQSRAIQLSAMLEWYSYFSTTVSVFSRSIRQGQLSTRWQLVIEVPNDVTENFCSHYQHLIEAYKASTWTESESWPRS